MYLSLSSLDGFRGYFRVVLVLGRVGLAQRVWLMKCLPDNLT